MSPSKSAGENIPDSVLHRRLMYGLLLLSIGMQIVALQLYYHPPIDARRWIYGISAAIPQIGGLSAFPTGLSNDRTPIALVLAVGYVPMFLIGVAWLWGTVKWSNQIKLPQRGVLGLGFSIAFLLCLLFALHYFFYWATWVYTPRPRPIETTLALGMAYVIGGLTSLGIYAVITYFARKKP